MSMQIAAATAPSLWERIAEWYQGSFIAEMLAYLSERYFSVDFGNYENISLSSGAGGTARNLILAFAAGFIIAFLFSAYTRVVLGGFVRRLNAEQCNSLATAKTLFELGYFRNVSIRSALAKGTALRMVVRSCSLEEREEAQNTPVQDASTDAAGTESSANANENADEASKAEGSEEAQGNAESIPAWKEEKIDFCKAAFYIPEELRYRADIRFEKRGSSWGALVLGIVGTVIGAAALCWLLPDLVQFADNLITVFAPK